MTKQELLKLIDSWENITFWLPQISQHPEFYDLLMDIALNDTSKNSWRAAWMIDKINESFPKLIIPYIPQIIGQLKKEESTSKKRHFLKQISLNTIPKTNYGFLVDYCLTALSSAKEPPAVRVHAMQILYNISEDEPDLKPELLAVIQHEIEYHSTAGIISRGLKLAKKLQKQIKNNS